MAARNIGRLLTEFLTGGDKFALASGEAMKIRPNVDDQGKLQVGDGTNDLDFEVYLGSSVEKVLFDVGNSKVSATVPIESNTSINCATLNVTGAITPSGSGYSAVKTTAVSANTATLSATHFGGLVKAAGTGEVALTLPAPAAGNAGAWVDVYRTVDENTVVNCATTDKIMGFNAATCNTASAATASEKIGAAIRFTSDGTLWYATALQGTWAFA